MARLLRLAFQAQSRSVRLFTSGFSIKDESSNMADVMGVRCDVWVMQAIRQSFQRKSLKFIARGLRHLTKWTAAVFLSFCCLLCFALAVLVLKHLLSESADGGLWFAAIFLAGLGATFAWSVRRVCRTVIVSRSLDTYAHSQILRDYLAEIEVKSRWPDAFSTALILAECRGLTDQMKLDEAEKLLEKALQKAPKNLTLLIHRVDVLAMADRWRDVEMLLESVLSQTDLNQASRTVLFTRQTEAVLNQDCERGRNMVQSFLNQQPPLSEKLYLLDCLSCLTSESGLRHLLPDADKWSELALQSQPENLSLKGTRGAILIEQGQYDEGESLLEEVFDRGETDIDKGVASLFLALCAKHRNEMTSAIRLARRAKLIYPVPWLLKRIESEFGKLA